MTDTLKHRQSVGRALRQPNTAKVLNMNPRHYWGITENGLVQYEGTFNECWEELTATYPDKTLGQLTAMNTRISRIK